MNYQKSAEFQSDNPEQEFKDWTSNGPKQFEGLIKPGNIDLTKRPLVHHSDGSVSSLYSMSFPYDELTGKASDMNKEVLVPQVSPDGRMMTPEEAREYARKTGQILGVFKTWQDADKYAEMLHLRQGAFQTWKNGGSYNPSVETHDNWTEPKEQ